ncbi:hypothetical protein IIM_03429 [Bacillus cereus VD107]|nr:hypothetical protein IIM_03429 [Bacillus cereus VD107]
MTRIRKRVGVTPTLFLYMYASLLLCKFGVFA